MPRYVLESQSRTIDLGQGRLVGTPAKGLFEFEVTLDETFEQILAWPVNRPATKDRSRWEDGPRRSPRGDEPWSIATNTSFAPDRARAATTSYLTEADHRWLAARIVEAARTNTPRYQPLIQRLVADLLRRWTADAIQGEALKVEAHWNDDAAFERVPSTQAAREAHTAWKTSRARRAYKHEHIVPVPVLAEWILALPEPSVDEVYAYLDRFCIAVLVHEAEEALLSERRADGPGYRTRMPSGWTMTLESDPWDRFKRTLLKDGSRRSLYDVIEFPEGHPKHPRQG